MSSWTLSKLATPLTALAVAPASSLPPDGLVEMASVIVPEAVVTVLPQVSCTAILKEVMAVPAATSLGCVRKPSLTAVPAVIANTSLVAGVRPVAAAPRR